jgi:putative DNA primase/helicase
MSQSGTAQQRTDTSTITLDDLVDLPRWVAWRQELRDNKNGEKYQTKIPYDPNRQQQARIPTDPSTWGSHKQAAQRWDGDLCAGNRVGGVGIVLGELDDGTMLMGIDLDRCFHPLSDRIRPWAVEVLRKFNTYAEVSPSGKGVKLFFLIAAGDVTAVKALLEGKTRRTFAAGQHREIAIDRARFYAVTENILQGVPKTLRLVPLEHVRWFVGQAGPQYQRLHGVHRSDDGPRSRDESRSGYGFRFMRERKRAGDHDYDSVRAAILADQSEAGEWARQAPERELQHTWENVCAWEDKASAAKPTETRPLISRSIDQFERRNIEWLWCPFLPLGMITLMIGDKAVGKSSVALDVAARISKGAAWPRFGNDDEEKAPHGSVIILCKENDISRIIRPRLEAAGADLSRIHTLGYAVPDDPKLLDPLERLDTTVSELQRLVEKIGDVKLIVVDPLTDYLGKIDMNSDSAVRTLLTPLGRLASRYDLAILNILHVNKKVDLPGRYRALGSVGFRNVAQSTLLVAKNDEVMPGERLLVQEAANLVAVTRAVSFSMHTVGRYHRVDWGRDWQDVDVDELMADKRKSKKGKAAKLLQQWLADGPLEVDEVKRRAKKHDIGWRTMNEASNEAGVRKHKGRGTNDRWSWSLE